MKRFFCAIILAVFLASSLFAASPKSSGLTESDIDAFIENFHEIDVLLEEKLDDIDADIDIEENPLSEILTYIPADLSRDISNELNKLGISGSNALEKVFVITYGTAYSYIKSFYDLMVMFLEDEDSLAELDAMMEIYTSSVSDDDFDLIYEKYEELANVIGFTNDTTSVDDYDWDDDDYDYDYDYDYDWDDYDYDYGWDDDYDYDYDYDYDWDDYDYDYDYDWDDDDYGYWWDDEDYYTEEEEQESEAGVNFFKELIPSLSKNSGSFDFLYKTIKPGTYTKVQETEETAFMFQKEWAGSKEPRLVVSQSGIYMTYNDPDDPDSDWYGDVEKSYEMKNATTELYKATIRGTVYYERVIKSKEYGTIRIWVDTTNLGEGEDIYYSSEVYAVLSIGDYIIEGTAIVAAG